jgi:hypothetical protein
MSLSVRGLRQCDTRGPEEYLELLDGVLASRTDQQMLLEAFVFSRRQMPEHISLGGILSGGIISTR